MTRAATLAARMKSGVREGGKTFGPSDGVQKRNKRVQPHSCKSQSRKDTAYGELRCLTNSGGKKPNQPASSPSDG